MIRLANAGITGDRDLVLLQQRGQPFDIHGVGLHNHKAIPARPRSKLLGEYGIDVREHDSLEAIKFVKLLSDDRTNAADSDDHCVFHKPGASPKGSPTLAPLPAPGNPARFLSTGWWEKLKRDFAMANRVFLGLAVLAAISASAIAQLQDIKISAVPKKIDEQKDRPKGNLTVTTKEIAYKVSVENRTFKTIPQLEVKYIIYYVDSNPGSKEKRIESLRKGSEAVADLAANRTTTFETKPLKLTKEELDAGWYWVGSGSSRVKDRVTGVWIRAYSNGALLGEYCNPTTVAKKNEWQD